MRAVKVVFGENEKFLPFGWQPLHSGGYQGQAAGDGGVP